MQILLSVEHMYKVKYIAVDQCRRVQRVQRRTEVQKNRRTEEYRGVQTVLHKKKVEYSRVEGSGKVRGVVAGKIQQAGWLVCTAVCIAVCTAVCSTDCSTDCSTVQTAVQTVVQTVLQSVHCSCLCIGL